MDHSNQKQQSSVIAVDGDSGSSSCRLNYLLVVISGMMIPIGSTFLWTLLTYHQENSVGSIVQTPSQLCGETANTPSNSFCSPSGNAPARDYSSTSWMAQESVTQTIEGNEEEKEKSGQRYAQMEAYLSRWIQSKGGDERFKHLCSNRHHLCVYWASTGECENNPVFMETECLLACEGCDDRVQLAHPF